MNFKRLCYWISSYYYSQNRIDEHRRRLYEIEDVYWFDSFIQIQKTGVYVDALEKLKDNTLLTNWSSNEKYMRGVNTRKMTAH